MYCRDKTFVNLVNSSQFAKILPNQILTLKHLGDSPIYYCQKIGKHTFPNTFPLQCFAMYVWYMRLATDLCI